MSCVFLHCFCNILRLPPGGLIRLMVQAPAGCARFMKLARKIRLSSKIQQKRFSGSGKRRRLFSGALGLDHVPNYRCDIRPPSFAIAQRRREARADFAFAVVEFGGWRGVRRFANRPATCRFPLECYLRSMQPSPALKLAEIYDGLQFRDRPKLVEA
jgi:hypothetical protein